MFKDIGLPPSASDAHLAWNLAHQVKVRPIPDYFVDVIHNLQAAMREPDPHHRRVAVIF